MSRTKGWTGFGRVIGRCVAAAVALVGAAMSVSGGAYTWDGGGSDGNWSTGNNWNPDGSVPVSASDTLVKLDGTNRVVTAQDVATPFVLNRLEFLNGPFSGSKSAFTVTGGRLRFEFNGATQPRVYLNRQATCVINNDVEIPSGATLQHEYTTFGVTFGGVVSGGGTIEKLQNDGGINLDNAANSFSGGLIIRAGDVNWNYVTVNASGAMGTGPVSVYGGPVSTNLTNPGGLTFGNTTTHTNPVTLFGTSPITASGTVTLNGPLSLGAYTLHLRGTGTGTLGGGVSGGGTNALVKSDAGTWTLAGANSYTGRVTVNRGTLTLGGSTVAGNVTVNGGTFGGSGTLHFRIDGSSSDLVDLNGGTLNISSLKLDFDVGAGGVSGTYVIVNYADGGTFTRNAGPTYFSSVTDLPAGYELVDDAATKRLLLARSQVYVWDGGGADSNWTTETNWTTDLYAPVAGSNTVVRIDGTNRTSSAQNVADPFLLNRLDFQNGPASGVKATLTLSGGQLKFVPSEAGVQPRIYDNRESGVNVNNAIEIAAGATLNMEMGTWGTDYYGPITGGGAIDKLQNAGNISLYSGANSFSGGLTVRAVDGDWYKVNVFASGAMGTGPVNLYGGTLGTAYGNPGGLLFFNTTTHANPINLFQNSPLFAGLPSDTAADTPSVTLSGNVDLNPANTLTLRGAGRGTLAGVISEGAATALSKVDSGRWTLSGANTFTGRVSVGGGVLALGGAGALPAGVTLAVAGGTLDLGGYPVVSGPVSLSNGQILNGALTGSSYAVAGTGVVATALGGPAGLTKSGAGTLALLGAQTFAGPLDVGGGRVVSQGAPAPGCALWLDAANPYTLAANASGSGGTPAPGQSVKRWTSLAGGNWASANDNWPTYETNVVSGLPVLRFGVNKGLYLGSNVTAQGATVLIVYRDTAPNGQYRNPLDSEGQTPSQGNLHMLDASNNRGLIKGGGAVWVSSTESGATWAVQTMQLQAGDYRLWVNENAYGPHTSTTNFTPFTKVAKGNLSIDVGEILVYTNILSASDRTDTIRYLRRKWLGEGDGGASTNRLSPQVAATVATGATLDLWGGSQTLATLQGAGAVTGGTVRVTGLLSVGDAAGAVGLLSVDGGLTLAAGLTNAVDYVAGVADAVNVSGPLTVEGAGTVALALNGQPPPQQITLLTCGSVAGEEHLAAWTVQGAGLEPYRTRVRRIGNNVVLNIFRGGTLISLR